jgi:hypothetical protein
MTLVAKKVDTVKNANDIYFLKILKVLKFTRPFTRDLELLKLNMLNSVNAGMQCLYFSVPSCCFNIALMFFQPLDYKMTASKVKHRIKVFWAFNPSLSPEVTPTEFFFDYMC